MKLFLLLLSLLFSFSTIADTWVVNESTDEMTGELSVYAYLSNVSPNKAMAPPYNNVKLSLQVGCDKSGEWVYFSANSVPNIHNTKASDGYSSFKTRIKYDNKVESILLSQKWGRPFLSFVNLGNKAAIDNLLNSSQVKLELQWHGESPAYFEFDTSKFPQALSTIRAICSPLQEKQTAQTDINKPAPSMTDDFIKKWGDKTWAKRYWEQINDKSYKIVLDFQPKHPIKHRDKSGYVLLSFTLNSLGGTEDVEVIDAEPKRIFDKEAKRALRKWKFKSYKINGKRVDKKDLIIPLSFYGEDK